MILDWNKYTTFNIAVISQVKFMTEGTLLIELSSVCYILCKITKYRNRSLMIGTINMKLSVTCIDDSSSTMIRCFL